MSILIKGMDMPTARDTLALVKTDGTAIVYEDEAYVTTAVPVPPHGKLIDVDALLSQYKGNIWTAQTDYAEGLRDVAKDIADAPTIIPAEEGET